MLFAEKKHFLLVGFICLSAWSGQSFAQDTSSSDGLLQEARKAAFDNKDYPKAKNYLKKALRISPDYADIKIFLGRIYGWTNTPDSARYFFTAALRDKPDYEDAFVAYTDLEFFNDQYVQALDICKKGLRSNPASEALMLREAKILNAQKKYEEADRSLQKLLLLNENNVEAKALAKKIHNDRNKPDSVIVINKPGNIPNQDSLSADGLLLLARKAAFDDKNYELAKSRLYRALKISPDYADLKIFLGRIHSWSKEYDSARYYFHSVLQKTPDYADASVALADLEYWNDDNTKSLQVINDGLQFHASSEDLLVRKARVLNAMRRFAEAQVAVDKALQLNRNNTEARSLANRIKESSVKNKISLSYDYVYFDKQFSDPWHLASFDYTRTTGIGSITGRINYANRFTENGVQYEIEAYPRISNTFYTYVNAGYSDKVGVFPQWRGGFSLYANLPKSFEGELGFRYLKFSGDPTWIYTGYLGKYYKSWLFGLRAYLTPSTFTSTASTSYTASARYYYGSADDLIGFNAGYGISPDDRLNSIQLDGTVRLVSYKAGVSFKKKISHSNVVSSDLTWYNQEYLPQTKGNQYQISVGWLHRF
ncbi:MAG: YaiO family outer membrane beta-barrel protein [Bacteroidota bacterium]